MFKHKFKIIGYLPMLGGALVLSILLAKYFPTQILIKILKWLIIEFKGNSFLVVLRDMWSTSYELIYGNLISLLYKSNIQFKTLLGNLMPALSYLINIAMYYFIVMQLIKYTRKFIKFCLNLLKTTLFNKNKNKIGSKWKPLIISKNFLRHLRYAIDESDFIGILMSYYELFKCIIGYSKYEIEGENYQIRKIYFRFRKLAEKLNEKIKKLLGNGFYLKNFEGSENLVSFMIENGNLFGSVLKDRLLQGKQEFQRVFPSFSESDDVYVINIETLGFNDSKITIKKKNKWEIKELDLNTFVVSDNKILLGFYPTGVTESGEIINEQYMVDFEHIENMYIGGRSRYGKDGFVLNIIVSLISGMKKYKEKGINKPPYEIFFFDTKGVDGDFLSYGSEKAGLVNYKRSEVNYIEKLEILVKDMENRMLSFGLHGNIINYNQSQPIDKKITYRFVIINELMGLYSGFETSEERTKFGNLLIRLSSEGLGAGYRLILIGHSIRKDIDKSLGRVIVNIKDYFSTGVGIDDARLILKSIDPKHAENLSKFPKYMLMHVYEGEYRRDFRPYYIDKVKAQEFVNDYLGINKEIHDQNIPLEERYISYSRSLNSFSIKSAQDFGLSFRQAVALSKKLQDDNLLEKLENNSLVWKQ